MAKRIFINFKHLLHSNPHELNRSTYRMFHRKRPNMDPRPAGHHSDHWTDLLKMLNLTMEVNEEKVEALVHTRGLTYADYNTRTCKPKPWHLMTLVEGAFVFSHHWPLDENGRVFRDYAQLTDDRLLFPGSCLIDIKPELYDANLPKSPLNVRVQGGFIGSSSFNSIATALTSSGVDLISCVNQMVSVDKTTRRPLPLPDWWKEKYAESARPHRPLKLKKLERPDNIPHYGHKVAVSDVDVHNHANWGVYVKYAFDAIHAHSKTGYLQSVQNFDDFSLKRMELLYSGECFDDDIVHVYVWEDINELYTVNVHIYKADNRLFQGRFSFFDIAK